MYTRDIMYTSFSIRSGDFFRERHILFTHGRGHRRDNNARFLVDRIVSSAVC